MIQTLSWLDIATGTMLGGNWTGQPLADHGLDPRASLERAILPALLRSPCLVSFSGGRDSSAVLALAVRLARREGLPVPIPATNVFPTADGADETEWQMAVVRHLGLDDWVRAEHDDELDLLGPYAHRVMRRHGLLLPFNVHFHLPLMDAASGGALLTGIGGDELFAAACARPALRDAGLRSVPRLAARRALEHGPATLRRGWHARRLPHLPWLRPEARRAFLARLDVEAAREPRSLAPRMAWWRELRYMDEGRAGLALIAEESDVTLVHPFLDRSVWSAVAGTAGPRGFASRSHGMATLFGDELPGSLLARRSKAHFDAAMWTATAQTFADTWAGDGIPTDYVDVRALREHWRGGRPAAQSFSLLQAAWLASVSNGVKERLDGLLV